MQQDRVQLRGILNTVVN